MSIATLGIDISKDKLDVALYQDDAYRLATFANERDGYRRLAKWIKKQKAFSHSFIHAGPRGLALQSDGASIGTAHGRKRQESYDDCGRRDAQACSSGLWCTENRQAF